MGHHHELPLTGSWNYVLRPNIEAPP